MKDAYEVIKKTWQEPIGRQNGDREGQHSKQRKQTGKTKFEAEGNNKDPSDDSAEKENASPEKKKLENSPKNINIKQ